jgi:hypothetical protein
LQGFDVKRALIAGVVYFLLLFSLGFGLGTVRVVFVAPRVGELVATLAELPVMLSAAYFTCRWVLRHWHVPPTAGTRWTMVVWFLAQLMFFETLLGAALFGRPVTEQWAALTTTAGMLGLSGQIVAAILPVLLSTDPVALRNKI